jgi:hypothetical protein
MERYLLRRNRNGGTTMGIATHTKEVGSRGHVYKWHVNDGTFLNWYSSTMALWRLKKGWVFNLNGKTIITNMMRWSNETAERLVRDFINEGYMKAKNVEMSKMLEYLKNMGYLAHDIEVVLEVDNKYTVKWEGVGGIDESKIYLWVDSIRDDSENEEFLRYE